MVNDPQQISGAAITENDILEALRAVMDPEIPTCSVVDLGIVERIAIDGSRISVDLLPTFAGCPALDVIKIDVEAAVAARAPGARIEVRYVNSPPWTTDRLSAAGKESLRAYGITPPGEPVMVQIGKPAAPKCPFCGSEDTEEQSAFGPTLCRTIRYCNACRNPFEGFKIKRLPV